MRVSATSATMSSLGLLLVPDTASSTEASPVSDQPTSTAVQELKRLTYAWVSALNNGDYHDDLLDWCAKDYRATLDNHKGLLRTDVAQCIRDCKPSNILLEEVTVNVERGGNNATVIVQSTIDGVPSPNVRTRGLSVFKWRCRKGKWLCYRHTHMKNLCDSSLPLGEDSGSACTPE